MLDQLSLPESISRAYDALLSTLGLDALLVSSTHQLLHTFGRGSALLRIPTGRPTTDLRALIRPDLAHLIDSTSSTQLDIDGVSFTTSWLDVSTEARLLVLSSDSSPTQLPGHDNTASDHHDAELRDVLDAFANPVVIIDRDERIVLVNAAHRTLSGHPREATRGKLLSEIADRSYSSLRPLIDQATRGIADTKQLTTEHGQLGLRTLEVQCSPAPDLGPKPPYILLVIEDVTDTQLAQFERQQLTEQSQRAQRLESLGALAGGIAHDFNNMLSVTLTYADLAMRMVPGDSIAIDHLRHIKDISRRASQMCHQMLVFSGKGNYRQDVFTINEAITGIDHLLSVTIPRGVHAAYSLIPTPPSIRGDLHQLQQAIINLTKNAIEALAEPSKDKALLFQTGATWLDESWCKNYKLRQDLNPGSFAWISISDSGEGIREEDLERILEPFFTTKFVGRGLGLSTVLATTHALGGALTIDSLPGAGTTITLYLPTHGGVPTDAPRQREGKLRCLLIDDELALLDPVKDLLEREGFEVSTASSGLQGVRTLRVARGGFDVALVDISMPDIDGVDAVALLRRIQPELPCMFITGYTHRAADDSLGLDERTLLMTKPFDTSELGARLLSLAREARATQATDDAAPQK